jgi:hypothetical protein
MRWNRVTAFVVVLMISLCLCFQTAQAIPKSMTLAGQVRSEMALKTVPGQLNYQGYLADAADSSAVTATLEMTFRLFDSETKGAQLWSETHATVEVTGGLFQVLLGSQAAFPDGLFDGTPLWLETEVGPEILAPRKPVVSTAYSHRANSAEMLLDYTLTDLDDRWINEGQANSITGAMIADGEINDADIAPGADIDPAKIAGTAWTADNDGPGSGLNADMVDGQQAADFIAMGDLDHLDAADGDPAEAVYVDDDGKVGIGTASPLTELDVNGSVNAATYYGDGSHLTGISGTSDGDWTISGSDMYSAVSGNVGIGTASPSGGKLHVVGSSGNSIQAGTPDYGMYGEHYDGRYGYLGSQEFGVYGFSYTPPKSEDGNRNKLVSWDGVRGECTGTMSAGVMGRHLTTGSYGSLGSQYFGVYGGSDDWAGYFDGKVCVSDSLGIGTTNPVERLHVDGAIHCADSLSIDGSSSYGIYVGPTMKEGLQVLWAGTGGSGYTFSGADGIEVNHADGSGLFVGSANTDGILVYEAGTPSTSGGWGPAGTAFHAISAQGCGLYVGRCDAEGVYINSTGSDGVAVTEPDQSGLYVSTAGLYGVEVDSSVSDGVHVESPGDDGVEVRHSVSDGIYVYDSGSYGVNVNSTDGYGVYVTGAGTDGLCIFDAGDDGLVVSSSDDDGVYVSEAGGHGGYFDIHSTSTGWAVYAHSTGSTGNGMYCYGNGSISGTWSKTVSTSKGREAMLGLSAPDEEVVASGTARLVNGRCRVDFERLFREAISQKVAVKIVLTPLDQWSGLYATDRSHEGFTVLTGAGAQNVEFTWQAIGRRQGYEERPAIIVPDPVAENARLAAELAEATEKEPASVPHERLRSQRGTTDARLGREVERVDPDATTRRGE